MPKHLEVIRSKGINTWETSTGPETRKRSLYVFQRRSLNYPFLETMDAFLGIADRCDDPYNAPLLRMALFCGCFLDAANEGTTIRPETLARLGRLGVPLGLDLYAP